MFEYSSAALYYFFNDRLIYGTVMASVRKRVYVNVPVDVGILDNNIIIMYPATMTY